MFEGHPFRDAPARRLPSARIQPRVSGFAKFAWIGLIAVIWNLITMWQLEGAEEATYTHGTDTITDRERFASLTVTATSDPREIADGAASTVIPQDAVPSFIAPNNKIVWRVMVKGDIPRWPDIEDEFLVDVVAHRRVRAKAAA